MNAYTKMVMVPQQDPLRNQEPGAPRLNQLATLDQQMQAILNDTSLSPDERLHKYQQTFQRYQTMQNTQVQQPQPILAPTIPNEVILATIPKQAKNKARMLLNHIEKHADNIKWAPDGRLMYDGHIIEGSNKTDLIHHSTRKFSSKVPGIAEFNSLLKKTNAPQVAVMQQTDGIDMDEFSTPSQKTPMHFGVQDSPFVPSTPSTKKKLRPASGLTSGRKLRTDRKHPDRYGKVVSNDNEWNVW
jgi:hypothetical protein